MVIRVYTYRISTVIGVHSLQYSEYSNESKMIYYSTKSKVTEKLKYSEYSYRVITAFRTK